MPGVFSDPRQAPNDAVMGDQQTVVKVVGDTSQFQEALRFANDQLNELAQAAVIQVRAIPSSEERLDQVRVALEQIGIKTQDISSAEAALAQIRERSIGNLVDTGRALQNILNLMNAIRGVSQTNIRIGAWSGGGGGGGGLSYGGQGYGSGRAAGYPSESPGGPFGVGPPPREPNLPPEQGAGPAGPQSVRQWVEMQAANLQQNWQQNFLGMLQSRGPTSRGIAQVLQNWQEKAAAGQMASRPTPSGPGYRGRGRQFYMDPSAAEGATGIEADMASVVAGEPLGAAGGAAGGMGEAAVAGAAGKAAGGLAGMGGAGAALGVGAIAYAGWEVAKRAYGQYERMVQLTQQYSSVTGGTSMGEMGGYEARARIMAISPLLGTEQARQIIMGTLGAGFRGQKAENVMGFVAQNVKTGFADIGESIQMFRDAVESSHAPVEALASGIETLRENARAGGAGFQQLAQMFQQQLGTQAAAGVGPENPRLAQLNTLRFNNAQQQAVQQISGFNLNPYSQTGQFLANRLGVSPYALPATLAKMPADQVFKEQIEVERSILRTYGARDGMTEAEALAQVVQFIPAIQILHPEIAGDMNAIAEYVAMTMNPKGTASAERTIGRVNRPVSMRRLKPGEKVNLRAGIMNPFSSSSREEQEIRKIYTTEANRTGWASGALEQLIEGQTELRDVGVVDPKTGKMMTLRQYMDTYKEAGYKALTSDQVQMVTGWTDKGVTDPRRIHGRGISKGTLGQLVGGPAGGAGTPGPGLIDFTDQAKQWLKWAKAGSNVGGAAYVGANQGAVTGGQGRNSAPVPGGSNMGGPH